MTEFMTLFLLSIVAYVIMEVLIMTNKNNLRVAFIIGVIIVAISTFIVETGVDTYATYWALLPPIVAIGLALITKEVFSSLFIGIVIGAILSSEGSFATMVDHIVVDGLIDSVSGTAGIFLFLIILGMLVALINKSGGTAAFGDWAAKRIKGRKGSQIATFFLGILIFIDDYFNCLTVGSVMRPVTDSHQVSRAKLAYIIDATAAPICMIAPISSWAAAVAGYAEGTGLSGIELFVRAIPFNFYSLLTLAFVITMVVLDVDYGPMAEHERIAIEHGHLGGVDNVAISSKDGHPDGKVMDLVLPILVLIVVSVISLVYVGGYFEVGGEFQGDFIGAFGNTDATVGLPWGAMITLLLTVAYFIIRGVVHFEKAMDCLPEGFNAMVPPIMILTMATSLKNISNDLLGSAEYVGGLMEGAAVGLSNFLPAVIFVVAILLAFATGTSWGTFGILIPIVASMFNSSDPIFFIGISACLSGAVCGDHCSPISDTTIMSSAGAGCVHVDHVSTQLPYGLTVAAISFICFLVAGFTHSSLLCLAIGIVAVIGFLLIMRNRQRKTA
jgi:tetracycline resistance efflux pump